jgi:hypothetical protein
MNPFFFFYCPLETGSFLLKNGRSPLEALWRSRIPIWTWKAPGVFNSPYRGLLFDPMLVYNGFPGSVEFLTRSPISTRYVWE